MTDAMEGTGGHGRLYWCIKSDLSSDGEIHVAADRLEVTACGALIAWGSHRGHASGPPADATVNLVCAPGRWSAAYAASPVDGGGVAVQSWAGNPRATIARNAEGGDAALLREVPRR